MNATTSRSKSKRSTNKKQNNNNNTHHQNRSKDCKCHSNSSNNNKPRDIKQYNNNNNKDNIDSKMEDSKSTYSESNSNNDNNQQNKNNNDNNNTDDDDMRLYNDYPDNYDDNYNDNDYNDDESDDDGSVYNNEDLYGELTNSKNRRPDFSNGAPTGSYEMYALNLQQIQDRKLRHHEVVRKILSEFDLESVKERYRGQTLTRDFSHANRKFRMWLEKEMGDDKIQLSDRKWHELFRQKVLEDYEHQQRERERKLAEAEVSRLQRLRLQGIISSDKEPKASPHHKHHRRSKSKKSSKSYDEHSNQHQNLYSGPSDSIETQMEVMSKRNSLAACPDSDNNKDNDNSDDNGDESRHEKSTSSSNPKTSPHPCHAATESETNEEKQDTDSMARNRNGSCNGHLGMSGSIRTDHTTQVTALYQEEDLALLYSQAAKLVRAQAGTGTQGQHKNKQNIDTSASSS